MTLPKLILITLLIATITTTNTSAARDFEAELKAENNKHGGGGSAGSIPGFGSYPGYPPGFFDIPGFSGGGWGAGYGGPNGGHSRNGVTPTSVVCHEKGPCYKKKLTCPAKCFTSYSSSGKGYGGGGGGGGCSVDCKKHCVAYC